MTAADKARAYAPTPSTLENNSSAMLSPNAVAKEKRKAYLAGYAEARKEAEALVEALRQCGVLASTIKQTSEWRKIRESELDANLMIKTIDQALAAWRGGGE
jgi:hypothetical protein